MLARLASFANFPSKLSQLSVLPFHKAKLRGLTPLPSWYSVYQGNIGQREKSGQLQTFHVSAAYRTNIHWQGKSLKKKKSSFLPIVQ